MKFFKKLIFKSLFNKRQRTIILDSIMYSRHTYERRGQINDAANVQQVINEMNYIFEEKIERESKIAKIINDLMLSDIAKKIKSNEPPLIKGKIIDLAVCAECDIKDECSIFKIVKDIDDENKKNKDSDSSEIKKDEITTGTISSSVGTVAPPNSDKSKDSVENAEKDKTSNEE